MTLAFIPGLDLAGEFYASVVQPRLAELVTLPGTSVELEQQRDRQVPVAAEDQVPDLALAGRTGKRAPRRWCRARTEPAAS